MLKLTLFVIALALAAGTALGQAPTLRIVQPDGPNLPADLYYGNIKVKPLRLRPGTNQVITIDDADFFVNQQYVDLLSRFPDQMGFDYWTSKITSTCPPGDQNCVNVRRVETSDAFFFEPEYQQSGGYVFRMYRLAFGNTQPFPNPDPGDPNGSFYPGPTFHLKFPSYGAFKPDRLQVIGGANLEQAQLDFANAFVQRQEFTTKYPLSQSPAAFINALLATIQSADASDLSSQSAALMTLYNQGGRGMVVYRLADQDAANPINNQAFIDAEYNLSFIANEYYAYLRRDGDANGMNFWLTQVNSAPLYSTTKQQAMVCSFITSNEYQKRFGDSVTHSNQECNLLFP
jgi:hypothetical protein